MRSAAGCSAAPAASVEPWRSLPRTSNSVRRDRANFRPSAGVASASMLAEGGRRQAANRFAPARALASRLLVGGAGSARAQLLLRALRLFYVSLGDRRTPAPQPDPRSPRSPRL